MNAKLDKLNHVDLLFPGNYLKGAELLGHGDVVVTISDIDPEHELNRTDGTTEAKAVLHFAESKKLMVLNKTNAMAIAKVYGGELKGWIGKPIALRSEKVRAFGRVWDAVRVADYKPEPRGAKKAADPTPGEDSYLDSVPDFDPDTGEVAS